MKNLYDKKFPSPQPIINNNGNYISEISKKKSAVVSFLEGNAKKISDLQAVSNNFLSTKFQLKLYFSDQVRFYLI